jgi:hypothetical protein
MGSDEPGKLSASSSPGLNRFGGGSQNPMRVTIGMASSDVAAIRLRADNETHERPLGADRFFLLAITFAVPVTYAYAVNRDGAWSFIRRDAWMRPITIAQALSQGAFMAMTAAIPVLAFEAYSPGCFSACGAAGPWSGASSRCDSCAAAIRSSWVLPPGPVRRCPSG